MTPRQRPSSVDIWPTDATSRVDRWPDGVDQVARAHLKLTTRQIDSSGEPVRHVALSEFVCYLTLFSDICYILSF